MPFVRSFDCRKKKKEEKKIDPTQDSLINDYIRKGRLFPPLGPVSDLGMSRRPKFMEQQDKISTEDYNEATVS